MGIWTYIAFIVICIAAWLNGFRNGARWSQREIYLESLKLKEDLEKIFDCFKKDDDEEKGE